MGLHSDSVDGYARILHPFEEVVDPLALCGLRVIVVVVEKEGVRVGLVGVFECLVDELLSGYLVHRGVTKFRPSGPYRAVGHRFVHHVPAVDDILVAVHYRLDVVLHVGVELFLGKEVAILVLVHPGTDLAVPHEGVTPHLDPVLAAEVRDLVGVIPVELTFAGFGRLGLHRVFGGDAVEFPQDEGHLVGV